LAAYDSLHLIIVKLYEPGRMFGEESALGLREAEAILFVFPRSNDVRFGHANSFLKKVFPNPLTFSSCPSSKSIVQLDVGAVGQTLLRSG
jgi:hypothetical protein